MTDQSPPWPLAAATAPWLLPGVDAPEAQRAVLGDFAEFPALVELPDRGVGADAVGRTGAQLAGIAQYLAIETTPNGWRIADAPGRDSRRATSILTADLDELEELTQGWEGPLVVGMVGPWTLAARIELVNGERLIGDPGATRDVGEAMAVVAAEFVTAVIHRVPGANVVLRLDEPELAAALAGSLPTQSGWGRLRTVPAQTATNVLEQIGLAVAAAGARFALRAPGIAPSFVATTGAMIMWHDLAAGIRPDDFGEWFDRGGATVFEVDTPGGQDRIGVQVQRLTRLAGEVGLDLARLTARAAFAPQVAALRTSDLTQVGQRLGELTRAIRTEVDERE